MHWDIYTGAAVISGATLILLAVFGGDSAAKRMLGLAAGFAFMGYGVYVASQASGTYYFPVVMFLIPLAGIVHFGKALLARSRQPAPATIGRRQPGQAAGHAPQQPGVLESWHSGQR
jgi:hypothetical protein